MVQQGGLIGGEKQLPQAEPTSEKDKPKPEHKPKPMGDCMRGSMRKLALWYTRNFKPLLTHDELEPILATLGFVSLPPSSAAGLPWKEYLYSGHVRRVSGTQAPPPLPRARLPYPRIDGLHINTYRAFLDAVNFFLEMGDISDLFHVRGLPLDKKCDKHVWRRMEEDENTFVYREGTLDQANSNVDQMSSNENSGANNVCNNNSAFIRSKIRSTPTGKIVQLSNIIAL